MNIENAIYALAFSADADAYEKKFNALLDELDEKRVKPYNVMLAYEDDETPAGLKIFNDAIAEYDRLTRDFDDLVEYLKTFKKMREAVQHFAYRWDTVEWREFADKLGISGL